MFTEPRRTVHAALYVGLLLAFPMIASAQDYSVPTSGNRGNDLIPGTTSGTGVSTNDSQSNGYGPRTNGVALVAVEIQPVDAEIFVDGVSVGFARDFNRGEAELELRPGTHVIVLYHPERRTVRMEVRVASGRSYRLDNNMPDLEEDEIAVRPVAALFRIFRQDLNDHDIIPASIVLGAAAS